MLIWLTVMGAFSVVGAAPGSIAQSPLFVGKNVQPNIFFGLDDSGSMKWTMPHRGAESAYFTEIEKYYDLTPDKGNDDEWRTWCLGANLLAYNPDLTYRPWVGYIPGTTEPFPSMSAANTSNYTKVWVNPRTQGNGTNWGQNGHVAGNSDGVADLTNVPVVTWTDTDGDGVYDPGECPTSWQDKKKRVKKFKDLSDTQKENFANWFTYYRTREFVAKAAVGFVADQSSARMGLATLHKNNNVGTGVGDMRDPDFKSYFLDNLYSIKSSGGTPLRRFLNDIGKYFSTADATPSSLFPSVSLCKQECDAEYQDAVEVCDSKEEACEEQCDDEYKQCEKDCDSLSGDDKKNCEKKCDDNQSVCNSQCKTEKQECLNEATEKRDACYNKCPDVDESVSPILDDGGECQQNFVVLMTDGAWNGKSPGVGHQDKTKAPPMVYEAHRDNYSDTLADVAMKWYKTDLAPDLADEVPTQSGPPSANLDENSAQHLVTFTVAFGPTGTLTSDPTDRNKPFSWPKPTSNSAETADDLRHAAYNGRGKFLSAKDPVGLVQQLTAVIADIEDRQGSAAAVAFNSATLESGSRVYVAQFDSDGWAGDLVAYQLDPSTGNLAATSDWSAASTLDQRSNADIANRVIYTLGASGDGTLLDVTRFAADYFQPGCRGNEWPVELCEDFATDPQGNHRIDDEKDKARLKAFRGDDTFADTLFRARKSRLGDIVHSAPVYVGAGPVSEWPDYPPFGALGSAFSDYASALKDSPRRPVVYVGANDGMLHGFAADSGVEVMAYTPSALASDQSKKGLHYLTDPSYNHRYYVDGNATVAEVYIPAAPGGIPDWRTILVGSLRAGGRGLFALDVSNPNRFQNTRNAAEDVVLWEFTGDDNPNLGYTFSTPQIGMMANGKWAVVVGNGYNSTGPTGTAQLFILFIEEGLDGWDLGDYVVIDTQSGTASNRNGLSTPELVDVDGDRVIDRIYAGDLHGDLWAFDVSDSDPGSWSVAYRDSACVSNANCPLFDGDPDQPITMKPLVWRPECVDTNAQNAPNLMVYFGTGQYLAVGDGSIKKQQYFYGVWDAGVPLLTRANLVQQTTVNHSDVPDGARIVTDNEVVYSDPPSGGGDFGWYYPLPASGERVVVDAFARLGMIWFNTQIPSASACTAGGGGALMTVKACSGGNPDEAAFDFNGDGVVDEKDMAKLGSELTAIAGQRFDYGLPSASAVLGDYQYTSGTSSGKPHKRLIKRPPTSSGSASGTRRSWIELVP